MRGAGDGVMIGGIVGVGRGGSVGSALPLGNGGLGEGVPGDAVGLGLGHWPLGGKRFQEYRP